LQDLLMAYPSPENFHIIPTTRDPNDHLALSSRNAYLTSSERPHAPTLHRALSHVRSSLTSSSNPITSESAIQGARELIDTAAQNARTEGVEMKYEYIEVFDKLTFEPIEGGLRGRQAVVAGAIWVGKTRLIDNLLIGWDV
jgi:pantoate--beta-alanine ligase